MECLKFVHFNPEFRGVLCEMRLCVLDESLNPPWHIRAGRVVEIHAEPYSLSTITGAS